MTSPPARITLLTDFGTRDGWIGVMKGVMAAIAPGVPLDDVSHDLPPGAVDAAARALGRYWNRYPPGTVHLAVVDPGVGTARRALAVEAAGRFLVAPDNGIATPLLGAGPWKAVSLENPAFLGSERSSTFHGRDLFAPAAGHLAVGVRTEEMGPPVTDPVRLPSDAPPVEGGRLQGVVVAVDRFGNLMTNLPGERIPAGEVVRVAGRTVPLVATYGSVGPGTLLALVNSDGMLEIAVRGGSAADSLPAGAGTVVWVGVEGVD
jgi:S-adenosyl-L-methionine hydrolase (adenosine-forming)